MKLLELTNSDQCAIVDDLFYEDLLALGPWRLHNKGYAEMAGDTRFSPKLMHRMIMELAGVNIDGLEVDHRNGDGLVNTLRNLRPATHQQNMRNRRRQQNNKSGFIGVSWSERERRWRVCISVDGKTKHLGRFTDKIEAARAYDTAAIQHFGGFARLNFPTLF